MATDMSRSGGPSKEAAMGLQRVMVRKDETSTASVSSMGYGTGGREGEAPVVVGGFSGETRSCCWVEGAGVWCGEKNGKVTTRDPVTGRETATVWKRQGVIANTIIRVGPCQMWIGFNDGIIRIFDLNTHNLIKELGRHSGGATALALGLASVYSSGTDWKVHKYCPQTLKQTGQLTGHASPVKALLAFNETSTPKLFSGSDDGVIKAWSQQTDTVLSMLRGHTGPLLTLNVLNGMLWSAADDKTIRMWDPVKNVCVRILDGFPSPVLSILHTKPSEAVTTAKDGTITVLSVTDFSIIYRSTGLGTAPSSTRVTLCVGTGQWSGDRYWTGSTDGKMQCWYHPNKHDHGKDQQLTGLVEENETYRKTIISLREDMETRERENFDVVERGLSEMGEENARLSQLLHHADREAKQMKLEACDARDAFNELQHRHNRELGQMQNDLAMTSEEGRKQIVALASQNEAMRVQLEAKEHRIMQLEESLQNALSDTTELSALRLANKEAVDAISRLEKEIEKARGMEEDLQQAREDRDMLTTEVRRLGDLLTEVSCKAKEYQLENITLLEHTKEDLSAEKREVEGKLHDVNGRLAGLTAANKGLEDELARLMKDNEILKERLAESPNMYSMQVQWSDERAAFQARIKELERNLEDMSEGSPSKSATQVKIQNAIRNTQSTLDSLQDGGKTTTASHESLQKEKEKEMDSMKEEIEGLKEVINKQKAELEQLLTPKNDDKESYMTLYAQLQHEQVVKSELQRNNVVLTDTIEQLKEKLLVVTSANTMLQEENDKLREADPSESGEGEISNRAGNSKIGTGSTTDPALHPKTLPGILTGKPSSGVVSSNPHTQDTMNQELDSLVNYIDNMKRKLDNLESTAENTADPHLHDILMQEINALHRQVLDDTLAQKKGAMQKVANPDTALDLPSPIAGGILKLASERLHEVESELGITRADPPQVTPPNDKPTNPARHPSSKLFQSSGPEGTKQSTLGDPSQGSPFPSYNPNSMANLVRKAYGFSTDVSTGDIHPNA